MSSAPLFAICVAKVCRRMCGLFFVFVAMLTKTLLTMLYTNLGYIGLPLSVSNKKDSLHSKL
nr:hypothetical protein [uncultured bacterium]